MVNPKRLWMVLSSTLTLGVAGVLVLAGTASGASALRAAANNIAVTAHAAGGGGGGGVGMTLTIAPNATLTAKLAATVLVSYTCLPVNGETFLATNLFVQVSERTSGKTVAQGTGSFNGFAVCDGTVNTASVVVIPGGYFTSPPFKKGTALATVNGSACSAFVASGGYPACDFGSAGPTTISIK